MRVLLLEEHKALARAIKRGLENEGFSVDISLGDEAGGEDRASYDIIVMEESVAGLSLLQRWRKDGIESRVLVLSANDTTSDMVSALADGHLAKPFQLEELLTRLRLLVRGAQIDPLLRVHDLEIDTQARTVRRRGQMIHLTPREFALLEFLALHSGRVVTRAQIWKHLYDGYDENTSNVVDVYIRYLRTKIDKGHVTPLILTRWGEGYMLRGE